MDDQNQGLKRIANTLGISITAASRAIRNADDIGIALKERVWEEAIKNGYVSPVMRRTKEGRDPAVVFIGNPDAFGPYAVDAFKILGRRCFIMPAGLEGPINLKDIEDAAKTNVEAIIAGSDIEHLAELYANLIDLPIFNIYASDLVGEYKNYFHI